MTYSSRTTYQHARYASQSTKKKKKHFSKHVVGRSGATPPSSKSCSRQTYRIPWCFCLAQTHNSESSKLSGNWVFAREKRHNGRRKNMCVLALWRWDMQNHLQRRKASAPLLGNALNTGPFKPTSFAQRSATLETLWVMRHLAARATLRWMRPTPEPFRMRHGAALRAPRLSRIRNVGGVSFTVWAGVSFEELQSEASCYAVQLRARSSFQTMANDE